MGDCKWICQGRIESIDGDIANVRLFAFISGIECTGRCSLDLFGKMDVSEGSYFGCYHRPAIGKIFIGPPRTEHVSLEDVKKFMGDLQEAFPDSL